jgi:nucleotide-binding universal stress UspA family protein
VAPPGYSDARREPPRLIAVGYDGTPESEAALRYAEALARPTRATVRVITVVAPPTPLPPGAFAYIPPQPPEPDRLLTEAVNSVGSDVAAEGTRLDGPPASRLLEACEDDGRAADLLIVGSRRYGPVARVFLGSVSTELTHRAHCPVVVVPRP